MVLGKFLAFGTTLALYPNKQGTGISGNVVVHCPLTIWKYRSGNVPGGLVYRVRQHLTSRRKTDWLTSQSKRLCRVKMT